jgi:phosphopantothenoylcysteine synthetase/decarboxylase
MTSRVLNIIICAAGPASYADKLVSMACDEGWHVQVIATPSAVAFLDIAAIEAQTAQPVRSQYSPPGSPRSLVPDAIIVAPATYNTINKWANGISDTYALGILAEAPGLGVPTVVLPFVNTALAGREAFGESVARLRREGVIVLLGDGGFEPHPPRTGGGQAASFPWHLALAEAERLVSSS